MEPSHRQGLTRLDATRLQRVALGWWSDQRCGGIRHWLVLTAATLLALPAAAHPRAAPWPGGGIPPGRGMGRESKVPGQGGTDARFIVMMIPHHKGAIAMAELARSRARHPEVRALAQRIISNQSSENALMRRWYRLWYRTEVPPWPYQNGWMGMAMGMGWSAPGTANGLESLRTTTEFDRTFLVEMINHHRMGVMMASHGQWDSAHPDLRELQAAMVRVQSEEIWQMKRWYLQWYG